MTENLNSAILKRFWRFLSISFWATLWLFALGGLLSYFMRWWPGDRLLPVRFINYTMPWLLACLIPALVSAGLARRKWLAITLAVFTISIAITYAPLFLPSSSPPLTKGGAFKVMSYNVWSKNSNVQKIADVIRQEQPDILLLQEIIPGRFQELCAALTNLYSDTEPHFAYESSILQAVVSRYPLIPMDSLVEKGQAQVVVAETSQGPIKVFNVHPLRGNWLRRQNKISALVTEDIFAADGPVILAGDFNTTDQTQFYRLVSQYLHNAHWEAGWGFGFTFPSSSFRFEEKISIPTLVPLVRIDHIFYNDHFWAQKAGTLPDSGGSDHLPVVAELILKPL